MSNSPLKPLLHPAVNANRPPNPSSLLSHQSTGEKNLASSSASSSQTASGQPRRADQVVHRFYLKTVNVLVDARLTHYGGSTAPGPSQYASEKVLDRWFNLTLPETDMYKSDLALYRHVSSYQPYTEPASTPSPESCTIPPLLIAFILDTSDLPNGQALLWCRDGGKVALNTNLLGNKGKGKEKEKKTGIVLERWTYRAQLPTTESGAGSQLAAHTAYRLGIIHFRAVYSLIRLLPAYRLFRRLRRANNGLRMGIKLWGPEGYPNTSEGLAEAWAVMERGLVGLDTGLDELVSGEQVDPEEMQQYQFPKVEMFGNDYTLGVEYRPEVDFAVEDMEAVLSEKFVDMDEDWFKPTVARKRAENETLAEGKPITRKLSTPTAIPPNPSPIPHRQQALPMGSLVAAGSGSYSASKSSGSRVVSGQRDRANVGSIGTDRWGPLAEGLPFAGSSSTTSQRDGQGQEPPSPSMATPAAIVAARRLSGHSIQPFASASPSASLLRSTPPQHYTPTGAPIPTPSARPVLGSSRPSSIGRTSSFLSQSGRSFTHAQIANMYAGSSSPPITGTMSGVGVQIPPSSPLPGQSPVSPSSLSFTKQPVPRSISGRQFYMTPSGSSPFIPGSLDKESTSLSSTTGPPGIIKRYSSSLSQRQSRPITGTSGGVSANTISGSQGSSADGSSLPGSVGQSVLRRTNTRESGLRHSLEAPPYGSGSGTRVSVADEDDIQAFLKTLDALPQPPSLAAHAVQASRSHLPSTSSSLSGGPSAAHTPSPMLASGGSPGAGFNGRVPLTRQQVDDELRRMAGSFSLNNQALAGFESTPTSGRASGSGSTNPSSIGLLSASRPSSATRRVPNLDSEQGQSARPLYRRQTSGGRSPLGPGGSYGSPVTSAIPLPHPNSTPMTATTTTTSAGAGSPMQALRSADAVSRYAAPRVSSGSLGAGAARSLPGRGTGAAPYAEDELLPLRSAGTNVNVGTGPNLQAVPHSGSAGVLSPQTTGGTSTATYNTSNSDSVRSRRGPVLLRGGFGDPSSQRSANYGSTVSSPSHSPVRDLGMGRGVGLGISRPGIGTGTGAGAGAAAGVGGDGHVHPGSVPSVPSRGISERLNATEDDAASGGWRGYQASGGGAGPGVGVGGRRQSAISVSSTPGYSQSGQSHVGQGQSQSQNGIPALTGPGVSGYPGLASRGNGQRTAPSSLGREESPGRGRTADVSSDGVGRVSEEGVGVEADVEIASASGAQVELVGTSPQTPPDE